MVILRPTRRLRELTPKSLDSGLSSDTALGDWYANRIVVDRQPLLLLISSLSLLPVLIGAREVRTLPSHLPDIVGGRLLRMGIEAMWVSCEVEAMTPLLVAKTADRSVLGSVVDFAKSIPFYLPQGGWGDYALFGVEDRLSETPCRVARRSDEVIFPRDKTPELLKAKWSQARPGSTSLN